MRKHSHHYDTRIVPESDPIREAFDADELKRICEMRERDFAAAFGMDVFEIEQRTDDSNFYAFRDNGAKILAVAHLDTVADYDDRSCTFAETAAGLVVHSRALDDRLGAYVILDMLPKLGIDVDVLLTVGEEQGRSTARFFESHKAYNWIIEFDRGGTDVVMYQYDDDVVRGLVRSAGAIPAYGSFSDISDLDHLGVKAFNWGVGYTGDYHGPRAHAYIEDTFEMLDYFRTFHDYYGDTYLPHDEAAYPGDEDDHEAMLAWWAEQGVDVDEWDRESGWAEAAYREHLLHEYGDPAVRARIQAALGG